MIPELFRVLTGVMGVVLRYTLGRFIFSYLPNNMFNNDFAVKFRFTIRSTHLNVVFGIFIKTNFAVFQKFLFEAVNLIIHWMFG